MKGREVWLEIAFVLSIAGLLTGLGVLLFGRVTGGAQRGYRHRQPAPQAGSIPQHRHQHIASNAAR